MMAESGKRTLLIDLHSDDPLIAKALGVDLKKNSMQMLLSGVPFSETLSYASNRNLALFLKAGSSGNLAGGIIHRPITIDWENLLSAWDCIFIDAPCFIADKALGQFLPAHAPLVLCAEYQHTKMSALVRAVSSARANKWRVEGAVITGAPRKHPV